MSDPKIEAMQEVAKALRSVIPLGANTTLTFERAFDAAAAAIDAAVTRLSQPSVIEPPVPVVAVPAPAPAPAPAVVETPAPVVETPAPAPAPAVESAPAAPAQPVPPQPEAVSK